MKKRILTRLISGALVLSLFGSMLPCSALEEQQPAATVPKWEFFSDDYENYTAGTDAFWNADTDHYAYNASYHGTAGSENYASYDIVEESGNQYLSLSSHGTTGARMVANLDITGGYTARFDYYHVLDEDSTCPQHVAFNMLEGYAFPNNKTILMYLVHNGVRITDNTSGTNVHAYVKNAQGGNLLMESNTWYTVEMRISEGLATLKVWPKGTEEPEMGEAGTVSLASAALTAEAIAAKKDFRMLLTNGSAVPTGTNDVRTIRMDNLSLTKEITLALEDLVVGVDALEVPQKLCFSTQSTQSPAPELKWVSSNDSIAAVENGAVVFHKVGAVNITATVLNHDGSETEISASCKAICDDGSNYNFFYEDFEIYSVGTDTFWNADTDHYDYIASYHGTAGSENYASYDIVEESGNQYLSLSSHGTTGARMVANLDITGGYTARFDYYHVLDEDSTCPQHVAFNMLEGYAFPNNKTILMYLVHNGVRITDNTSGTNVHAYVKNAQGGNLLMESNTWYTVEMRISEGLATLKVWPKGTEEPEMGEAGTASLASDALTVEAIAAKKDFRMLLTNGSAVPTGTNNVRTIRMDELRFFGKVDMALDAVTVDESEIGTTRKISLIMTPDYVSPECVWTTSDDSVVTVSEDGTLTFHAKGAATVTAQAKHMDGTLSYLKTSCTVTVGDYVVPLRVLSIGNSFSRDSMYYLADLAEACGKNTEIGYLHVDSCTLRMHADNAANDSAAYAYWRTNGAGELTYQGSASMSSALSDRDWDVVVLQQNSLQAGFAGTYNSDLDYLTDYIHANTSPDTKLYWNMVWTYQEGDSRLNENYGGSRAAQYNAMIDCMNEYITGNDAFDGVIPTGAAIRYASESALGDGMYRDGFHLSTRRGRLTAAMTWLKYLFPDAELSSLTAAGLDAILNDDESKVTNVDQRDTAYANNDANLAILRTAVTTALTEAASENGLQKLATEPMTKSQIAQTVAQVEAPQLLHFPDTVTLPSGKSVVMAYQNVWHSPTKTNDAKFASEGGGRLVIFTSSDNGTTWSEAQTLVDEDKMEQWGLAPDGVSSDYSQRYALLNSTPTANYVVLADPRDPNLAVVHTDLNGDGTQENVLLATFWVCYFMGDKTCRTASYMMQSADGGETWSVPQKLQTESGGNCIKRGTITCFADGRILVPVYSPVRALYMQWNRTAEKWDLIEAYEVPNTSSDESKVMNEMAFIAPNGGDTVYAMVRESGAVLESEDRGKTWTEIGNVDGLIHQPGFVQIDSNRVFATWCQPISPRPVYGQMFYVDADWSETAANCIYRTDVTMAVHDMGDPSAALLSNGDILTVYYDAAYRAILATRIDANDPAYYPSELNNDLGDTVSQTYTDVTNLSAAEPEESYCLQMEFVPSSENLITVTNRAGIITLDGTGFSDTGSSALTAGESYTAKIAVIGKTAYGKLWLSSEAEPEAWMLLNPAENSQADANIHISVQNAIVRRAEVTKKIRVDLEESRIAQVGDAPVQMSVRVSHDVPYVWNSSNPTVATVSQEGLVTFLSAGETDITVTAGQTVATCKLTVLPLSAELTQEGIQHIIFSDDFSGFTAGNNTFYDAIKTRENGYYTTTAQSDIDTGNAGMNIRAEGENKYLELQSGEKKSDWVMVDEEITGDYTVQFDYMFTQSGAGATPTASKQFLYITLFQNSDVTAFIHLTSEGMRFQYRDGDVTVNDPAAFSTDVVYTLNQWYTIKIIRVNGGIYAKTWEKGTPEPEEWTLVLKKPFLDTSKPSSFRFQYYVTTDLHTMGIDNLLLTQYLPDPVDEVIQKIEAIGTISLDSNTAIQTARAAYDALTPEAQQNVTNYSVLTAAEALYAHLLDCADGNHSGGTATCDELPVCEFCHQPYGSKAEHSYGEWVDFNRISHKRICLNNPTHVELEQHHFVNGVCNVCGKTEIAATIPADAPIPAEKVLFTDVSERAWYYEAVTFVAERGMIKGTGEAKFSPNDNLTRAMLMTILARLDGVETGGGTVWYEMSMKWAVEQGISDGSDPEGFITREQLAAMLYRYAGAEVRNSRNLEAFADQTSISDYAIEAMEWAVSTGILNGFNGMLNPHNSATRAEAAAMLMRFCKATNK